MDIAPRNSEASWLKCPVVRAMLQTVQTEILRAAETQDPALDGICDYVAHPGAKRLRPTLLLLAASFGNREDPILPKLAAALEITHVATLYHDDIVDEPNLRRGRASANVQWGNRISAFAGDFLLSRAVGIFSSASDAINQSVSRAICEVSEGHMMEAERAFNPDLDEAVLLQIAERKTGVLFRLACEIGAAAARVPEPWATSLVEYGRCFGIAFQLVDDVLDIAATEDQVGKPVGADLRSGVYTVPVAFAIARADHDGERLRSIVGEREMSDDANAEAISLIRATGAPQYAATLAGRILDDAKRHTSHLPDGPAAQSLRALAESLHDRVRRLCVPEFA